MDPAPIPEEVVKAKAKPNNTMNNEEQIQDLPLTVSTEIKAGGIQLNHNEADSEADALAVSTDVKAGGWGWTG